MEFKRIYDLSEDLVIELFTEMVRQVNLDYAEYCIATNCQVAEAIDWARTKKGPAYWAAISSGQVEPSLN